MFCITLTVTKNIRDDQARRLIDDLIVSVAKNPTKAGGSVAHFRVVGARQIRGWFSLADEVVGFILSAARSGAWGVHLLLISTQQAEQFESFHEDDSLRSIPALDPEVLDASRASGGVRVMSLQGNSLVDSTGMVGLGLVEASLQLLCSIERRRSDEGQEAGLMVNSGHSQLATARQLGVSQQAVSSRLQAGYWYESRRMAYWLAEQLGELLAP